MTTLKITICGKKPREDFGSYCCNDIKWFWYKALNDVGLMVGPIPVHFGACTRLLITIQLEKGFQ